MLRILVRIIDEKLRSSHRIKEYTSSPSCIFRMEVISSTESAVLSDGTAIHPGDRIINLHLWNEQIPRFPRAGPTLGWALRMSRALQQSLAELDAFLAIHPELDDIIAIRADMSFGSTERSGQLTAMAAHYGFECVGRSEMSLSNRLHRFGENILISMLVLLWNPAAFRCDSLWRTRTPVVLSRKTLRSRFGAAANDRITTKRLVRNRSEIAR
jgi:hypothetical protein